MSKTKFIIILSLLLSSASCSQNMDDYVAESASDRIITGILSYNSELDRWEIRNVPANTIDVVNMYVVKKYEIELPKDTRKNVQATGRCYESSKQIDFPTGTTLYYIEVESLGYISEPPASIDNVAGMIEVKYGEEKEFVHNGQVFKFSITDIEDHLADLSVAYIPRQEDYDNVKIHVCLRVETDRKVTQIRVIARPYRYKNDGTDMQHISDLLEEWQSTADSHDSLTCFKQQFVQSLGNGVLLESASLGIYMAKAYSRVQHHQEDNKSLYKFIFIITD